MSMRGTGLVAPLAAVPTTASSVPYVLARSAVAVSAPADTTEDTLATISVPADALGANGWLRITTWWDCTNNVNVKTARVRYNGAAGTAYLNNALTNSGGGNAVTMVANRGATNSQYGGSTGILYGGTVIVAGPGTDVVDTTAATSIVITGQKATAGDTLTLSAYLVELIR